MYVGRLVIVGPTVGAYRVSSRSFPNRQITEADGTLTVIPTPDAEATDNPYISYNCLRTVGNQGVIGNGSHVDPIAEKLELGYPPRDALAYGLLTLDYEKDSYDTPRIGGIIGDTATIGIVRRDALIVREVTEPTLVATYEKNEPEPISFSAATADEAASDAYDLEYEHPVCAGGIAVNDTVTIAYNNGPET